jgi:DNA-binding GntR family transcriptional regulator
MVVLGTEKQIERIAKSKHRGTLMFPEDFSSYGSSEAVRKALERLENKNVLVRVAQGIYVRPKESALIGAVIPTAEEVAEAIAKRDKIRTVPSGSYALNALGLSTQIPMKIVLLTDGSPREIKVGRRTIKFKKVSPKNLLAKGKVSRLAIQALKELGKENISEHEEKMILKMLHTEDTATLKHDIALAPVWIQKIMSKALNDVEK